MPHYFKICLGLGVFTEALAYALCLWLYHRTWVRFVNIVVVFGMIYGGMSWLLAGYGAIWQFGIGAALGLVIEISNDRVFKIWYFPGDPWPLRGQAAVIGVGLAWGLVPMIAVALAENVFV